MFKPILKLFAQSLVVIGLCSITASVAWADEANDEVFKAVLRDDGGRLSTLFVRGADPNATNAQGQTALILAIRDGQSRAVAQLLGHPGIRIDQANRAGETPLMMAALKGQVDWMRQLLDRGASIQREQGWTPLHYAATSPSLAAVQVLLDRGAGIDARSPNGSTPLMMAARYGAEDAVGLLLARSADPRLRNELGLSAADFARQAGREKLAEQLAQRAGR